MNEVVVLLGAYLIGSIPSGYIFTRLARSTDIRLHGSGNIGATNVFRVAGPMWGTLTGVADLGKGWGAVALMGSLHPDASPWWRVAAALCVIAGHNWTVWLGFRGGRGVLTSAGAFAYLAWAPLLSALGVFLAVLGATRYVSAASLAAAVAFIPLVRMIPGGWQETPIMLTAIITSLLIIIRHLPNIRRLAAGREPRVGKGNSMIRRQE